MKEETVKENEVHSDIKSKTIFGISRNSNLISDNSNENNSNEQPKKRSKVVQFNTLEKLSIIDTASKTGK